MLTPFAKSPNGATPLPGGREVLLDEQDLVAVLAYVAAELQPGAGLLPHIATGFMSLWSKVLKQKLSLRLQVKAY